jgi:structure-specific endonuclease subunit SLX1
MSIWNKGDWVVYLLQSRSNPRRSYIGATNDLTNRIRKHNGEIKGGAKYTSKCRPWELKAFVYCFKDCHSCFSFEWHSKRYKKKRSYPNGANAKMNRMFSLLSSPKFSHLNLCLFLIEES